MNLPKIAIPTLGRYETISQKTLCYLQRVGYPSNLIYLFVVAEEEALYKTHVPEGLYGHLVVGVRGICNQRNFITNYFEEGELVCGMDDDVRQLKSTKGFLEIVQEGVKALGTGGGLFGVLPNDDTRRMKDSTTSHLAFIIGCFYIYRIHKDLLLGTDEKDDVERPILYFKRYGKVFRYQGAGVSTSYKGGKGGLQQEGRKDRITAGVKYLLERYPGFCKKRGSEDVLLNWRAFV